MAKKDPNQKGSGARKHRRNYRLPMQFDGFVRTGDVTAYRARHGIPKGSRKDIHRKGDCPLHNR